MDQNSENKNCGGTRRAVRVLAIAISLAAFTTAGYAADHVFLSPEVAGQIKTIKLISIIPQAALVPTVAPSGDDNGGANEGAPSGSAPGNAYKVAVLKLAPLVAPQKRIDLRQEFLDKLKQAAVDSSRFDVQGAETVTEGDGSKERDQALKISSLDAVLTVLTHYSLSPDFKVFNVTSQAELWQNQTGRRVFLGQWRYHSPPRVGDGDKQVIAAWAANNGEALVTVAHEAAAKIAMMMEIDLLGQEVTPEDLGTTTGARVLMRRDGWNIERDPDGNMDTAFEP
jgi:hypothetical protein